MERKITIYRGDEHRAKIERTFCKEDIFAEVYGKAYRIVDEIIKEMRNYQEERMELGNYAERYSGLGNNILLFCGARGQGKTSAMQSFARCLNGKYAKEKLEGISVPKEMEGVAFEVIDSIDPSAMENNESILRVLLSRLFYQLEARVKKDSRMYREDEFIRQKKGIIDLFHKCYANIDYIKAKGAKDYEEDDLEKLSQLGSSAKLKDNLYGLIKIFLDMVIPDNGDKRGKYLVIPVDDADLATKKVFCLCEDIRNYLSVPNVIVLMAVDYKQLVDATYQKYLKSYAVKRKAMPAKKDRYQAANECYSMAAEYLEKVFPNGHRINLPQMDGLVAEGHENIQFTYVLSINKEGKPDKIAFGQELSGCKNMQEQLFRLIYLRTGIVFVAQGGNLHGFLPHTFRELAHWLKMLYDMNSITCDEVYQMYQNQEGTAEGRKEKLHQLKENIQIIKQYFINYWCKKNLDESEMWAIQEIDAATQRRQMAYVGNILGKHLDDNSVELVTFRKVMRSAEGQLKGKPNFQEAIYIYYTIYLNEWFATALGNNKNFPEIAEFLEYVLEIPDDFREKYKAKYLINQFCLKMERLNHVLGEEEVERECMFLESFCAPMVGDEIKNAMHVVRNVDTKWQLNSSADRLEFHVLRPIWIELKNMGADSATSIQYIGENEPSTGDLEETQESIVRYPYLIPIRNLAANYDVQRYIRREIALWYEELNQDMGRSQNREVDDKPLWENIYKGLYQKIDEALLKAVCAIGNEKRSIKEGKNKKISDIFNQFGNKERIMCIVFLCNSDNFEKYREEWKKYRDNKPEKENIGRENTNQEPSNGREGTPAEQNRDEKQLEDGKKNMGLLFNLQDAEMLMEKLEQESE